MINQIHIGKLILKFLRKMNQTSLVPPRVLMMLGWLPNVALVRVDNKDLRIFLPVVKGRRYFAYKILFLNHGKSILPKWEK